MLGLCGEFERVAKVVLDKAEKESHARKKRKNAPEDSTPSQREPHDGYPVNSPTANTQAPPASTPFSPSMFTNGPTAKASSPTANRGFGTNPTMPPNTGISDDLPSNVHAMPGLSQDFPDMLSPDHLGNVGFGSQPPFGPASPNMGSFQQPFVPQDLWQMPMTIEWDWADMSSNFPVFEAGGGPNGQPPLQ